MLISAGRGEAWAGKSALHTIYPTIRCWRIADNNKVTGARWGSSQIPGCLLRAKANMHLAPVRRIDELIRSGPAIAVKNQEDCFLAIFQVDSEFFMSVAQFGNHTGCVERKRAVKTTGCAETKHACHSTKRQRVCGLAASVVNRLRRSPCRNTGR